MPYSRMDRQIGDDLFTLSYICEFINELKFDKITVVDPHSDQTLKLLKNANAVYPVKQWLPNILLEIGFNLNFDCIIFPDKGAKLKYQGMMSDVLIRRSFMKVRNPVTGVIESTTLEYKLPKDCKKCVIVDDLCSKGGTFLWAGKILRQNGVEDITLAVSHCEDSVFEGSMFEPYSTINRIYTSNSILSPGSYRNIKVLPVNYEMV
jgi:ribose-phosphate pyrophosphokinase